MAVVKLLIVEDNTAPPIEITCKRDGVVIDLTGSTVDLIISSGTALTNTGHTSCSITSATTGVVEYQPQTGDFSNPGTYSCDVQVTYGDGTIERLYDRLKVKARRKVQ